MFYLDKRGRQVTESVLAPEIPAHHCHHDLDMACHWSAETWTLPPPVLHCPYSSLLPTWEVCCCCSPALWPVSKNITKLWHTAAVLTFSDTRNMNWLSKAWYYLQVDYICIFCPWQVYHHQNVKTKTFHILFSSWIKTFWHMAISIKLGSNALTFVTLHSREKPKYYDSSCTK